MLAVIIYTYLGDHDMVTSTNNMNMSQTLYDYVVKIIWLYCKFNAINLNIFIS